MLGKFHDLPFRVVEFGGIPFACHARVVGVQLRPPSGDLGVPTRLGSDESGLLVERLQVRPRSKAPQVGKGKSFLAQLQGELFGFAGDASGGAVVHDANGDRVLARFQKTSGNGIFTHRVMMARILVLLP